MRDFWRRWHRSLGRWLRDQIYIPLGGSRRGLARECLCLLAVFLVSGLWHGAELSFVLWGLAHGLMAVLETLLEKRAHRRVPRALAVAGILLAWVLFRAGTVPEALEVYRRMLFDPRPAELLAGLGVDLPQLAAFLVLPLLVPPLDRLAHADRPFHGQGWLCLLLFVAAAAAWCVSFSRGGNAAFIYFRF